MRVLIISHPLLSTLNFRGRARNFYLVAGNRLQNRISISSGSASSSSPTSNRTERALLGTRRGSDGLPTSSRMERPQDRLARSLRLRVSCARGGDGTRGRSDCACAGFWDRGARASGLAGPVPSQPRGLDVSFPFGEQGFEFAHQVRVFRGDVVLFAFVPGQVVQLLAIVVHDQLP
mgnify:CR=1 FL=1